MIHVLTVHWKNPAWIPIQRDYLRRWTDEPYRTYAALDPTLEDHAGEFDIHVVTDLVRHAMKLGVLADIACSLADPGDLLCFIDSDAFPVAPWVADFEPLVRRHRLIAVRRSENLGDPQPHPSFSLTTPEFWKSIPGTWRRGPTWINSDGREASDIGAILWQRLADMGVDWLPLLRSNRVDLHPLFFGIYGDRIYHHGAGSRKPRSRVDAAAILEERMRAGTADDVADLREVRFPRAVIDEISRTSERLIEEMVVDPDFYRQFT